ncbi:MAG TPA: ABC transporter substrate-binding protein [Candidatus Acidoferrales bacterium]|nr:ABC transporter substrate-binding protein [Candidatus Acidoferrales bacterium]
MAKSACLARAVRQPALGVVRRTRGLFGFTAAVAMGICLAGCGAGAARSSSGPVVFLTENMPANLDPRIGTDAQSQYLDSLIFSSLVSHDDRSDVTPDLATAWDRPDPLTYVFHLRRGARFQNGQPLIAADVKYTFDSILSGAVKTAKRGSFAEVGRVDAPDDFTVVFHLRQPSASFLWDLVRPAVGIVARPGTPAGDADPAERPIGSGPFRFVRSVADEEVTLERNPEYFGERPGIDRVIFRIVPDAITRALELRKGSADLAAPNSLTPDMAAALGRDPRLRVSDQPGSNLNYVAFNLNDRILAHRRVRQALAYATDRAEIIKYLLRGQARIAYGLLPPSHWAYDAGVPRYDFDPARAERLLDQAGFPRGPGGVRFHLTLKTSTEESARLLGAVLQQQWRQVGVVLALRSLEFGTFYADITRGSFQLCTLRWIGANNDPAIFYYVFDSAEVPPAGANRGHYRNPDLDRLLRLARVEPDRDRQKLLYVQAQEIVARDLPYLTLWYADNVVVHDERIENVRIGPAGGFDFLGTIELGRLAASSKPR